MRNRLMIGLFAMAMGLGVVAPAVAVAGQLDIVAPGPISLFEHIAGRRALPAR